jgi:Protein of unknown function (DUF2695)
MPDQGEKARRKAILQSQREDKRRSVREGLPAPAPMMKALFDYIDQHLSSSECDDTLRYAREFIHAQNLPEGPVIAWLESAGGHCDCEAINNAEELLEDAIPGYRDLPSPEGLRE